MPTTPRKYPRHETRALLRAHLSAATRYGHATRHCPVCHRLQRLAMEPTGETSGGPPAVSPSLPPPEPPVPPVRSVPRTRPGEGPEPPVEDRPGPGGT
ncbi:DUF6274 family protein [Streptomyces sp. CNQ085]|uniref:DUF6274 family protein n=1 Tax=Streptomyces sp. CNQ085 TaxID=2886944 RepID=UPI001F50B754|nr:DUF6274 family protein [Streptomyces sp. CNQ085]MCI0383465.1 DUF6274 family protein [Streptomyces sp. CNQ085]